ncbi:MAG: hypothetical protein IKS31_11750 [Clostridia bacterium]|nr:hypothetical protein [Clostridia bacterium]
MRNTARLLALLLLLALAPLAAAEAPITGDWTLITVTEEDGIVYPAGKLGYGMRFTLEEGGAATGYTSGHEDGMSGEWHLHDGVVTIVLGDALDFALGEDGLLRGSLNGSLLTLRRIPVDVPAADAAEFEGAWTLLGMAMGDSYQEAADPKAIRLEISGTDIDFILKADQEGAEPETERFASRFEGGVLLTEAEGMTIRVSRTDTDGLRFTMAILIDASRSVSATYWFVRAEE